MKNILLFISFFHPSINWHKPINKQEIRKITYDFPAPMMKLESIYDSLNLLQVGLSRKVFNLALIGWQKLKMAGRIANDNILSIVDFSQPSSRKRLYIIDLANVELLFNTYVAHGRRSGKETADHFSNKPRSLESSIGFYVTANPYMGSNGYSLRLDGVENGFNSNAAKREIVLHGANYVSEDYINSNGYLGRSWGCPAVPMKHSRDIIDIIKNGTCLFIYSPMAYYLAGSKILNGRS